MIEVVFSDSACGTLKYAQSLGKGKFVSGCVGIILTDENGNQASGLEIQQAKEKYVAEQRAIHEKATPFGGSPRDVFGFSLCLSVGDISEENFLANRHTALDNLYSIHQFDEPANFKLEYAETLATILSRAKSGEPIRVWHSNNPDEACGVCWFMAMLRPYKDEIGEIFQVKLPEVTQTGGNTLVSNMAWGGVSPEDWSSFITYQTPLTPLLVSYYSNIWRDLQAENSPLRVVLNGKLVSVSIGIYDDFINRELDLQENEFNEAKLIGGILGKYQLGIGDVLIAHRIEEKISQGLLVPLTKAPKDSPIYCRMLRKV